MEIKIEDKELKRKISKLYSGTSDMRKVMRDCGIIMKNSVLHSFDIQSDGKRKWEDLSPQYKKEKQKKKGTAYPILVRNNRLRQSFSIKYGKDFAMVYTGVKYGVIHQTGKKKKKIPKRSFMVIHKEYKSMIIERINRSLEGKL